MKARSEDRAEYLVPKLTQSAPLFDDDAVVARALDILRTRLRKPGAAFSAPADARKYLALCFAEKEQEIFTCLWLDSQNRLIEAAEMFRGTLTQAAVYPREVVKAALANNAAAVIFSHNHPSGCPEPSRADEALTRDLKAALALVDVKVLDHIIVAGVQTTSFAERGLL